MNFSTEEFDLLFFRIPRSVSLSFAFNKSKEEKEIQGNKGERKNGKVKGCPD
jgi:hypothetical protein